MQYIKKQNTQPTDWDSWFAKGDGSENDENVERSYIYKQAHLHLKECLLAEQNNLCAYCQKEISINASTVEHVVPQSINKELSTNYHNLVLVCSGSTKGEKHCDKARLDKFIINLIFSNSAGLHTTSKKDKKDDFSFSLLEANEIENLLNDIKLNAYFDAYADGTIKPPEKEKQEQLHLNMQIKAFIEILNLNHESLKAERKKAIEDLDDAIPSQITSKKDMLTYWKRTFYKIVKDRNYPYRQFLLLYIGKHRKLNLT
jgi:uncharacterized protein (TIGR02646 family)